MLNSNHPNDEHLSALASRDSDATADAALTSHVDACDRCTDLVTELGVLRASLAELPDLAPSRPLRLLPEVSVEAPSGDRLAAWVRRLFAPALTAGAALAMVGLVGTASPAFEEFQDAARDFGAGAQFEPADQAAEDGAEGAVDEDAAGRAQEDSVDPAPALGSPDAPAAEGDGTVSDLDALENGRDAPAPLDVSGEAEVGGLPAERSPWPMVLFTGVALMAGAALLRWILVPRAG